MLSISRKKGESLTVGNCTQITVTEIKGDRVRIGITAPKDVPIVRDDANKVIKFREEKKSNGH